MPLSATRVLHMIHARWLVGSTVLALFAAGAWSAQEPERHWLNRNGEDWLRMGPGERTAYLEGFLAGAAFAQAAGAGAADSAALSDTLARFRREGRLAAPFSASVYATRLNDYYWWENHRSLPTWYALWELNRDLTRQKPEAVR
jgi:hypothetical protein